MSGTGFGVAGHKNAYSTSVRCGNWVEDVIGHDLSETRHEAATEYISEARRSYMDPRLMEDKAAASNVKIPSLAEITVRSREGLSWDVLFSHGHELPLEERFVASSTTQYQPPTSISTHGDSAVSVSTQRMIERQKQLRQEEYDVR